MSDLISRSDLKKEIESIYLNVSGVRSGKGILAKCMDSYKKAVLEIINNQPIAYDVESVMAELEAQKWEVSDWRDKWRNEIISNCIDIVKRGGIE